MWQEMTPFFITSARCVGFFCVAPCPPDMGMHHKVMLGLVLGLCLSSIVPSGVEASLLGIALEVGIGMILAIPLLLLVEGAAMAGELIDTGRGQMIAQAYDPFSSSQSSVAMLVFKWGAILLLISSGLIERLLIFLAKSYVSLPYVSDFSKLHIFAATRLTQGLEILSATTSLAFLFLGVFALCDVIWIFASRVLQGVPTNDEVFVVKLIVGFALAAHLVEQVDIGQSLLAMLMSST